MRVECYRIRAVAFSFNLKACLFPAHFKMSLVLLFFLALSQIARAGSFSEPESRQADISFFQNDENSYFEKAVSRLKWAALQMLANKQAAAESVMAISLIAPPDITVECNQIPAPQMPAATTTCNSDINLTLREVKTNIQCENAYVLQRIWIATDTCAGVARDTQFVTVKDTQKPTLHLTHPRLLGYEDGDTVHLYCDQGLTFDADDAYATDNCDGSASVIFVDYIIENSDCARNGYLMKMVCGWIAEDNCNNRDSITLIFLVFDNIAPVFGTIPDTQVIDCHRLAHIIQPEVTDNCEGLISITSDDVIMPGRCTGEKMIMRTWRAFDQCGNNSSKEQVILVRDTTAPVFVGVPRDTFIACDAAVPAPAVVTAVDNCSPNVSVQFSETYSNDGCREVFTRTWSSTDDCGNTGVAVQVISLIDTVGPIITSTPDLEITIECDEDLPTDFPLFEDNCSMALQYDSFSTIIPQDCGYLLEKTWTATDSCGNTTAFTQKVFVVDTTDPVLSNIPADTTVRCDEMPPVAQVTSLDNCDPNVQIVFEEDTLGTVCADLRIVRTWTAIDSCGNSRQASQMIQITDDEAPSLFNVPGDVTLECDSAPLPDSVFASDNCDQNVVITVEETTSGDSCTGILTKIWTATDVCGNSSSASQVITFIDTTEPVIQLNHPDLAGVQNGDTLYFECEDLIRLTENDVLITDNCDEDVEVSFDENVTAAADCQQEGYFEKWTFTWQANDNCGNISEFFLTIFTFDSAAPVLINVPDDFEADCDANIPPAPAVDATDNCSGAVTIELSESMEFNGCDRKIIRIWTATDNCGNASSQSQVITLIDEVAPKVVAAPRDTTIKCDASEPLEEPVFEDNCSDSLTITAISSIAQQPCGYIIVKEWTATDDCGNSTTYTRTITAIDSQPPVFSGAPADTTIFCNQIPNPPVVTATDNCDDDIQVNYQEVIHNQSGCSNWRIVRTWSATDDCGNRATTWQTIMIQDNEPPVFSADPADVTVECGQIPPPDTLTATDNCGNVSSLTFEENRIDGNCPDNYTLVRVWEATDECGNLASVSQVVTVVDNTPPTLVFNHPRLNGVNDGDTIIFECGNLVLFGEDDVITTDNCSVPDVDFTEDISGSGDCMNDGFFEKLVCRWTATDACGNSTSLSIVVIVTDLTSPEFINFPDDLTINCNDELPEVDSVQIRDNCPLGVSLEFMETQTTGSCPGEIIYERTWTATDHCGNSAVRTQIITQTDTIPPTFVNVPQDLTVSCDSVLGNPDVISAVDNCTDSVSITFEEEILDGNCPGNATVLRTWTATDDCGNSASVSQTITIFDNEAPVFGSTPTDITIECDIPVPDPITPVVSDNCDANVTTTLTETRVDGNCAAEYEIRREWTATDHCGNTSTITQTVFVRDTDGPLVSDPLEDLFISCDALVPAPVTPDFDDNCSDSITIIFSENILPGNCSESSTIVRTWTAVDECGNQNSTVQNIFIRDNTPPAVISQPGDLVVDCSEAIADESPVFEDNCDDDLDISFIADTISGACAANFTITRTW